MPAAFARWSLGSTAHSRLRIWFFVTLTRIVFGSKGAWLLPRCIKRGLACDRDFWVTGLRQAQAASHSSPRFIPWGAFIRVEQPSSRAVFPENLAGPTIIVNAAVEAYLDTKSESGRFHQDRQLFHLVRFRKEKHCGREDQNLIFSSLWLE